ncbi:imidazole glycerol phosphate synthase subunit HisH [Fodinicurvata fenggangensis]|uniref:imidazole glycerol phosphate synthase subunit HisH n=1 Tax=Fodinicurvata fenggangensis TaxID=1121830 RepID=UPI00047D9D51|nr:imidazole glycerol phosphate synthase subunit HisH [Fodinicurvata fenggangensis]
MTCVIIDYGSGNLRSAAKALERAAAQDSLGIAIKVSDRAEDLAQAERIVLPGVGAFGDCRQGLAAVPDMMEALEEEVRQKGKPFLGICVGMQLMAERGVEHGTYPGLGWISGEVKRIEVPAGYKIPHMGWNDLSFSPGPRHPVLDGLEQGVHAYFVHSYSLRAENPDQVLAWTDYGTDITAVVGRDNLIGTQFHPEKSQAAGLRLLANFLRWTP